MLHISGHDEASRTWGWKSDVPTFVGQSPRVVRLSLEEFVRDADSAQVRAWDTSIPWLQRECGELVRCDDLAKTYTAILEYELPRDSGRPDVILLENGAVVVMELKGKFEPSRADVDQVAAYARDLRCYHAECAERPVIPILVPTLGDALAREVDGVKIAGPRGLHRLLLECAHDIDAPALTPETFLRSDAYAPLPSLVRAARDLFARDPLPRIKRASAATDPAVERISEIAHEAAATGTRRLVLLTGVPGSGKTLVGLRLVHAGFLDDLGVDRAGRRPTAPAVFLSGNAALVKVLQDALASAGGGGKVFVRGVKDYMKQYLRSPVTAPPEKLLVFDEAQRMWDADHFARKHKREFGASRSEPEHFVEIAERIPGWCVVVALLGTGQEINAGEQGGIAQWRSAVERCGQPGTWTVHAPGSIAKSFASSAFRTVVEPSMSLDTQLRFHHAQRLGEFVEALLDDARSPEAPALGAALLQEGYCLRVTRDLEVAKQYARDRYEGKRDARFGLLASAKAKDLPLFGVDNTISVLHFPVAKWFNAPVTDHQSCCSLWLVATEFVSQGLELDLAILAWGSDFLRDQGRWSARRSGRTNYVTDILGLRRNVYRVLLTRGRDGTVVFVPPSSEYDETCATLRAAGAKSLDDRDV